MRVPADGLVFQHQSPSTPVDSTDDARQNPVPL